MIDLKVNELYNKGKLKMKNTIKSLTFLGILLGGTAILAIESDKLVFLINPKMEYAFVEGSGCDRGYITPTTGPSPIQVACTLNKNKLVTISRAHENVGTPCFFTPEKYDGQGCGELQPIKKMNNGWQLNSE